MVQTSFLPKYCADQGLPSWRKMVSPVASQYLEGGYKTPAIRALLQYCTMITQFLWVEVETEILFLLESCAVQ